MPLTRLDNLLSSKTGKYIYVSPDDFNASDALDNRGNSQLRPFVSIQRAFLEVARFSYVPGVNNDRFDQFTIMLSPGPHYIDNRPGDLDTSNVPIFNYDAATDSWNDPAIFDLGNPNNILYRFNGIDGGATIPRGTSLVGADLRRTQLRPLYVPDPADTDVPRTALFNVTGGCYFWQFTILDANPDTGPLNGQSYSQPGSTQKSSPLYSHHKMTNFVYADKEDLSLLYRKISKCFSKYQEAIDDVYTDEAGRIQDTWSSTQSYTANTNVVFGGEAYKSLVNSTNKRPDLEDTFWERLNTISREFDYRIQENRIVGPLADTVQLDEFVVTEPSSGLLDVTVRTKINHGFFPGQYVAIDNTGLNRNLEGVFQVYSISTTNPKEFKYRVVTTASAVGLIPGASITPNSAATVLAEIDSVESASPYVFNVSIRSVWGICGIWADGRKATGFKSMVIAQYTGVSLQKDDRAFIRYDEFSNTWNQAPLTDAFATTPYHIKGDAFFKDDWRTFHVRASDDSFIQNVSIFAVGFADHFLLESGGDMSITNSNSNFGNTSMHSKGFKGFAFNQDKGGYITDIIPPKILDESAQPIKTSYYPIDVQLSKPSTNSNRLYLTGDKANNFLSRPAASINKYRIGARTYINDAKCEKIYVNTTADQTSGETGSTTKSAVVYPQGFKMWSAALDTLSPANLGIGDFNEDGTPNTAADTLLFNLRQDAANLIDANKIFIQAEAFGYILEKYPYLQTISYVNPNITFESGRYRDARNLILANRQEIVDYAYNQMLVSFPTFTPPSADKCKRDIGLIVDAVAADLYDGGNAHMIEATKTYFDVNGDPIVDGVVGEVTQSIFAFNRARDWAKKAISNLLGNTSLVPVISLTSSGTTVTATTSSAHNLKIGQEINVGGATQSQYNVYKTVVLASGLTPTQFKYQVAVAPTVPVATGASGALYVSKVTIDPENTLNPAGRYKNARNRILANREFILDASLAEIAVYHPDFYIPGDTQSNVQSRFADAFRLIRRNSKEIADRALAKIAVDYPDFYFPGDAQTTADSRFNDSYRLIQQNKTEIVNTAWTSMVALYPGVASTETKCKRDLGYFVDAISLDLFIRGNEYSYRFAAEYFTNATTPLSNGLVGEVTESVYAFNQAKTLMKSAITNQLTIKDLTITPGPATYGGGGGNIANTSASSCADVRSSIDTLSGIVTATITAGNLNSLPIQINKGSAPAGAKKCARDIGYFIDAVSVDVFTGGNKHTRTFIQQYFTNATTPLSNGLVGETAQSNTAFNEAAEFMRQAVVNVLYYKDLTITPDPSPSSGAVGNQNTNNCANVRSAITTLASIATSAITAGNLNSLPAENAGTFLTGEIKCRRDIGHIVDAVAQDLWFGGNEYTIAATKEYFTNATTLLTNGVAGETGPSITSFRRAQDLMNRAANNQYYNRDLTITLDTTQDPPVFSDIHSNVFLSIMDNKNFIAKEAYQRMKLAYPSYVPQTGNTEQDCLDDVYNVLEQIAYDIKFGGNAKTYDAANVYVTNIFNGQPVQTFIDPERDEAAKVFLEARKVVTAVINNVTVTPTAGNTETQVFDFTQTYDWDADENLPKCGSAIAASETLFAIIIQAIGSDGGVGNLTGITRTAPVQPTTYTLGNCSDVLATIDTLISITVDTLYAGNLNALPPINNGEWDCANVRSTIDTLFLILTTALSTASILTLPPSNPGPWSTVSESSKCRRDIGYIVEAITADLRLGGNENTVNAAEAYFTGTAQQTLSGTLASNGVITGLTSTVNLLAGMAVTRTSGAGSFGVNPTILSINSATQITVTQVSGTVTAGAISFIANQLDYIEKERVETLDAYDYVRNLAISAMRNHNTYLSGTSSSGSPIITVSSTNGLVLGMSVRSVAAIPTIAGSEQLVNDRLVPINYTTSIPSSAYIKKIGNGSNGLAVNEIQLGAKGSKFDSGVTINATASGPTNFFFQLNEGIWTNAIKPSVDPNVIQDYNYTVTNGECASVVENINTYFTAFSTVINNGIGSVAKKVSSLNTGSFARRTTLFTLTDTSSGAAPTDPHHLETGTPVRLVPRVKAGAIVDKRLIRLPKGFDTNTVYYVIAPGRKTDPEDYSNITRFDGVTAGSFQNLMLASSIENAATGIYIYSSETENVDPNVIIDVYQYVLDLSYNLNQYGTKRGDGTTFVTEEPHLFDKPNSSWNINDNQKYQAIFFKPIGSGSLPSGILPNREYFARYINKITLALNCQFEVYDTLVEAIAGANPKNFTAFGGSFYVFSNKKRSPLRFAPEAGNLGGTWYLGTDAAKPNTILERIRKTDFVSKDKTPDTWFERISDDRNKEDRVYRLRYVVPKYLKSVREPLRGFIIKSRNDQTRRLLPQKLLIKPTAAGSSIADLSIPNISAAITGKSANREYLGYTNSQHGPLFQSIYDPYNPESISSIDLTPKFRRKVTTDSKITFYIQSAKTVSVGGTNYLEITVFDLGIEEQGYKEKLFTTVKIDVPQGGTGIFVSNTANLPSNDTSNIVTWGGAYKGKGRVHQYFNYENQNYMILKDITFVSTLDYDPTVPTIFTQGSVSAALTAAPNGGRSNIDNYLYATEGANVYTMTPGDTFQAENGNYTIASVIDVDDFENTFYIFDINTIRRRIFGQQDGIYYLTCLRGDIAPFPTGAGVGNNFRGYKFSQPVSKLYPQFYKNDPEWYKQLDSAAIDPPASISAADNYIHGLVTVNDAKSSVTKEGVIDLIRDKGTKRFTFSGNNQIQSKLGGASAGSEARRIPISGDSQYATEGRLYVELRRPSIARSGNHTFEYLGFGPGNYSTGFPARQEVILTDIQDFYAQAKRQNGGIVFYTGLNSNGDLYIGNRKINAITGEETFLESAQLLESEDDNDEIGNFVTTFDGPVTFNDIVTFAAVLPKTNIFTSPIVMDVATVIPGSGLTAPPAFTIKSNINGAIDDNSLRTNPITSRDTGDIVLTDNRLKVAVIDFNNRGLQDYSVRTAIYQTTPDQLNTFGVQSVSFGTKYPLNTGDILLKGEQVGTTGSVAWIYANNFITLLPIYKYQIQGFGTGINKARIIWPNNIANNIPYTNAAIGIKSINYQVRLVGLFNNSNNTALNSKVLGAWSILASTFNETNNFVDIITNDYVPTGTFDISNETGITISTSNVAWKEVGIIGAESIRTQTDDIGDYKVGINTVARASHAAYLNAFVESGSTDPRANLDIVGTTFISGKTLTTSPTNNFKANSVLSQRTFNAQDNAFLVGGDSAAPNNLATLRLSTTSGRVGINTTNAQLNGTADGGWYAVALGVLGDGAFSGKLRVQDDLMVNGGDITTTATTFNFINSNANVLNVAGSGQIVNLFNNTTAQQNINIGNSSTSQSLFIGNASPVTLTSTIVTELRIHRNSTDAKVDIATVADIVGRSCDIKIGGAWINTDSKTLIGTRQTILAGELEIGNKYAPGTSTTRIFSQTRTVNIFDGAQTVAVNLAPNASDLKMGSSGGFTTIRNNLSVLSSANVEGNIRLNGGVNAGIITIQRARFNTSASAHVVGSTSNPNIDFYKYQTTGRTIDTQGVSQWGSTDFLVSGGQIIGIGNIVNTGGANRTSNIYTFLSATSSGTGTGATFNITINADKTYLIDIISAGSGYTQNDILTITNNQLGGGAGGGDFTLVVTSVNAIGTNYFLPISTPGQFDFKIGDLIFIDRDNAASPDVVGTSPNTITGLRNQQYSEIVKVVGLTNLTNPNDQKGYRIEVLRAQDGTALRTDHPQGCILAKFDKQSNASYITGADLDGNGIIDLSSGSVPVNVPLGTVNINIGVAEFGGTLTTSDYLRLSLTEIVKVFATVATDIQSLIVNDGGFPAATTFKVESTTGNTSIFGNLGVGTGFNRFTVNGNSGNTTVAGTLTTENTLTINGSTIPNTEFFKTTNGGATGIPLRTTFQIDTATGSIITTGSITSNGGDMTFYSADGTTPRLTFVNSSGDFATYGSFSAFGSGLSRFGGPIQIGGTFGTTSTTFPHRTDADLTINGGNLTINSGATEIFKVSEDGSLKVAGIENFVSRTGGFKWEYSNSNIISAKANTNYFIQASGTTLVTLPTNALIGDMIRIIDIAGTLTYNISLVVRAGDGIKVQNSSDNTAQFILGSTTIAPAGYQTGGEMVVQTPYASFALVYAGPVYPNGNSATPSSLVGWYLTEV